MLKKPFYKNTHVIIFAAAITTLFILGEVLYYINVGTLIQQEHWEHFFNVSWSILIQVVAFLYLVHFTIQYFNKKYAAQPNSLSRFLYEILFISLAGFIIQEVCRYFFIKYSVVPEDATTLEPKLRQLQMISMIFLLVIYAFVTLIRIFRYMQQKQLDALKWQREYTENLFQNLKNQLNPHFLFNSLSVLSSLVYIDADKAEAFIEKLSKTYRYLLEQKDQAVVSLQKELEFLDAYRFLIEQRFGKKLQLQTYLNGTDVRKGLPPNSLMIAMEYIIANNSMSNNKPLLINVKGVHNAVQIEYSYQPKAQIENNSEQQLHGLHERYKYLAPTREMQLVKAGEMHVIEFPLLEENVK